MNNPPEFLGSDCVRKITDDEWRYCHGTLSIVPKQAAGPYEVHVSSARQDMQVLEAQVNSQYNVWTGGKTRKDKERQGRVRNRVHFRESG